MKIHNLKNKESKTFLEESILLISLIIGAVILFQSNILHFYTEQQFVELAQSFAQGKLYFLQSATVLDDTVIYQGHAYWPLGPLPAVILMPFAAIWGDGVQQGYAQFPFLVIIFFLLFKIAQKITGDLKLALWLAFGYVFSSAFIGIALIPWAWQYAQITATLFILLALYEYFNKKRWILVGIYIALAVTARINLLVATCFFGLYILFSKENNKEKFMNLLRFALPIGVGLLLLFTYNFLRFHSFLDQGYTSVVLTNPQLKANVAHGLWGLQHMPENIYYFLLKGPEGVFIPGTQMLKFPFITYNPWGLSIIFTTPMFLWILKAPFKNKEVLFALLTASISAFSIFCYYGIGYSQFGYRYALDFYPFLFLVLAYAVREKSTVLFKRIIIISCLFNLYLLFL